MNRSARITALSLGGVAAGMLALSFAAEPLYSTFCRVTGFGGTTQVAETTSKVVLDRDVRIRFDSNVNPGLSLDFDPLEPFTDAKVGQTVLAFYEVENTSDRAVSAMASFNVAPYKIGNYFKKVECFCFTEQTFEPGERKKLPVLFFIDPEIDEDEHATDVRTITLSYTFYPNGEVQTTSLTTNDRQNQ